MARKAVPDAGRLVFFDDFDGDGEFVWEPVQPEVLSEVVKLGRAWITQNNECEVYGVI